MSLADKSITIQDVLAIATIVGVVVSGVIYVTKLETRIAVLETEQKYSHGDLSPYLPKGQ